MIRIALLALLLSGCAAAPWTDGDTRRELVYVAALAADSYTTARFSRDPNASETLGVARSIYGAQPDAESVLITSALAAVIHYWIARRLDTNHRKVWQWGFAGFHAKAAIHNCRYNEIGC